MTYTLKQIAKRINAELHGNPETEITGLATLQNASSGDISFLSNSKYRHYLATTNASAIIVCADDAHYCDCSKLVVDNPYVGYARASHLFDKFYRQAQGISATAKVHKTATVHPTASIGEYCVISEGAVIEKGVVICAGSIIGEYGYVGEDSKLYSNVHIYHECHIGARTIIHSGAVIGADGFGFANDDGVPVKIAQIGKVVIGDDVEIGANTTIDRGAIDNTVIGNAVKIDNQVQIGHNVIIGDNTVICGCCAIAGSAVIGKNCTFAGDVLVIGHITITDGVTVTSKSLVSKPISKPGVYSSGTGLSENLKWRKSVARIHQLDDMARRLRKLESR